LRIGIVGLVHGHVEGLLGRPLRRNDLQIVGVCEPNRALFDRLATKYNLDPSLYYASIGDMLEATRPEVVSRNVLNQGSSLGRRSVCPVRVHLFLESAAFSNQDARRIDQLAREHGCPCIETLKQAGTPRFVRPKRLVDSGEMAPIRKMVSATG